jgi:hypothetical protein
MSRGTVISPERTMISASKLCFIYRQQEGNMSGQYLYNCTVPTTWQPTQMTNFCQRNEVWERKKLCIWGLQKWNPLAVLIANTADNRWTSGCLHPPTTKWTRGCVRLTQNVNNGCATEHAHRNRNGETAFPVTCTILGPHQLLGKIQKEMLFRRFGSTGL